MVIVLFLIEVRNKVVQIILWINVWVIFIFYWFSDYLVWTTIYEKSSVWLHLLLVESVLIQSFLCFIALIIPSRQKNSGMTDFSYMYKSLFPGRSYSTYSINSVASIWALVLSVTLRTTWGGMFGHWSYSRKFKAVGEGKHGPHPFWGGGMDCFF